MTQPAPQEQQEEERQQQQQLDYMAAYVAHGWDLNGQLPLLIFIAAILGLGKGGVPAIATIATALTVLTAAPVASTTNIPGALGFAVSLQVPILCIIDCSAAWLHSKAGLNWHVIRILAPFAYIGMVIGQVIDRHVSDDMARVMVGSILLLILGIQLVDGSRTAPRLASGGISDTHADNNHNGSSLVMKSSDHHHHHHVKASDSDENDKDEDEDVEQQLLLRMDDDDDAKDDSAKTKKVALMLQKVEQQQQQNIVAWGAFVGIVGGAATMMTNSMGPLLNVYLLSIVQLSPASYVGTRAMFFCIINLGKLPLRLASGTLGVQMLPLAGFLGLISAMGVVAAKPIMLWLNPKTFVRLELAIVAFAGLRLCWMGLVHSS